MVLGSKINSHISSNFCPDLQDEAPRTKNVCFVGCVSKIMPNNFFVDGCGCQEVELRTSMTNGLSKI